MLQLLVAIFGGSALGSLFTAVGNYILQMRKHRDDKDDSECGDIQALKLAVRLIMLDRVRYLGLKYISEGEIDFDDRRILNQMHDSYHNGLGGNGDLDQIMRQVNQLPLKTQGRKHDD
jgi:hypothetical protein